MSLWATLLLKHPIRLLFHDFFQNSIFVHHGIFDVRSGNSNKRFTEFFKVTCSIYKWKCIASSGASQPKAWKVIRGLWEEPVGVIVLGTNEMDFMGCVTMSPTSGRQPTVYWSFVKRKTLLGASPISENLFLWKCAHFEENALILFKMRKMHLISIKCAHFI